MTDYCEFNDMAASACSHCNPSEGDITRHQSAGEKADSNQARGIFKAKVLEVRPGAVVRDIGTATEVTVDGTKVWVKATLAEDATKESYQFHDAEKMITTKVEHIALVNTFLGEVHIIGKEDADTEARRQLQTHPAGRVALKLTSSQIAPFLRTISEVFEHSESTRQDGLA